MKIKWNNKYFLKLNISAGRNPYHGVNGILTLYHIWRDPYFVLVRCTIVIIPCCFIEFINAVYLTWDTSLVTKYHQRYSSVTKCKYYPILGEHNYWSITDSIDKHTDEEEYEALQNKCIILFGK